MSDTEKIVYGECKAGGPLADATCLFYIQEVLDADQAPTDAVLHIRGLLDARAAGRAQRMEELNVEVEE